MEVMRLDFRSGNVERQDLLCFQVDDAILVLNRGVIDDIGRHEELLARNDIYSGLWHQQNSHVTAPVRRSPTLVS